MAKNSSIFNFKNMPFGFLLALMMILTFESLNACFDNYFYQWSCEGLRVKIKNELAYKPDKKFDFLILGDCYPHIGIIPKIIEDKTGLSGFNLSTNVIYTVFSSYCFLKNYLKASSIKPRYVVISFLPESCRLTKQTIKKENMDYFYDFKDHNQLSLMKEFGLIDTIRYMLPSLKHHYIFRELSTLVPTLKTLQSNSGHIDSFIQDVVAQEGRNPFIEDNINVVLKDTNNYIRFDVSPFFDKYLRAILDLAQKDHIKVIYLIPTMPAEIYKKQKEWGNVDAYYNYLSALKEKWHDLIIFDTQKDFDQLYSYSGGSHLNFWGAVSLSNMLARKIFELEKLK